MKQGDFSKLAKDYIHRPGYSDDALRILLTQVTAQGSKGEDVAARDSLLVADIGAGTGKLTEMLCAMGLRLRAVEPNDAMREEGEKRVVDPLVTWSKGSGEDTGLQDSSVDWLTMASSFHWVDFDKGMTEFSRVLKPGGMFTALWNPRDLSRSALHMKIEATIYEICPHIERVSSGSGEFTKTLLERFSNLPGFEGAFYLECNHEVVMTKDRYMGAWRSVNDIQAQAGPQKFEEILEAISEQVSELNEVVVPYKTKAWSVRKSL